jgi:hypothetical protein
MAILCGLAIELHRQSRKQGKLFYSNLLKKMVAVRKKVFSDTKFAAFPDYVLPYIIYLDIQKSDYSKNDTFTCAVNSIIIKLEGITAHAGEPEKGSILRWR